MYVLYIQPELWILLPTSYAILHVKCGLKLLWFFLIYESPIKLITVAHDSLFFADDVYKSWDGDVNYE